MQCPGGGHTWGKVEATACGMDAKIQFDGQALALVGEFNNWEPRDGQDWATKNDFGTWTLFLPDAADGTSAIPHR